MGTKATKAVVRQRVEEVYRLRLGGAEFHDMLQHAAEQSWGVGERQLWNYVAAADRLVAERFDARAGHLLNRHLLQRRQLFAHAMGAGDFRTALAVLQDEAKLEALYPPTKIAPTNPEGTQPYAPQLSNADRAAALVALRAALGAGATGPAAGQPAPAAGPLLGPPGGGIDGGGDAP